jgi:hypothetical protein
MQEDKVRKKKRQSEKREGCKNDRPVVPADPAYCTQSLKTLNTPAAQTKVQIKKRTKKSSSGHRGLRDLY